MSFQDWLLLSDWCLCIPGLILSTVTVGPELCLQPSYLRNDGLARLKVLWEDSMERQRWENVLTLMHFNAKWTEMLPSCRALFLSFCQGSLWHKWVFPSAADLLLLGSFLFSSPLYPPLCVLTCTFILIHITSDMFYENTKLNFFLKRYSVLALK